MSEIIENIQASMETLDGKIDSFLMASNLEMDEQKELGAKTKEEMQALNTQMKEMADAVQEIAQATSEMPGEGARDQSMGAQLINSDVFQAYLAGTTDRARLEIQANTITGDDTIVAPDRKPGIVPGAFRKLRVADVLPSGITASNAIEMTREASFTNAAAETAEGVAKPESALTFELMTVPVRTIAHWLKLSRQVRDDAPMLASYVDTRLRYGVELRLDTQLVTGDGVGVNISGLLDSGNYTVFTAGAGDNEIESIRKAMTQVELADYSPTAVIMNPTDVQNIDLTAATDGMFIAANPRLSQAPQIWGLPIVSTSAVTAGQFILGAFDIAAQVWYRQGVTLDVSEHDDTNFQQNLITVRAEMRAALAVYRPASIVGGALTV